MKNLIIFTMISIATLAYADELATAEARGASKAEACMAAKEEAKTYASYNGSVVTKFSSCSCEDNGTNWSSWYCTVNYSMRQK